MLQHDTAGRKKQRGIVAAFFFLSGILTASWSSRIPEIQQKLSLNNAALGTVLFAIPVGLVIGLALAGRLVAHHGARRMMLAAPFVTASGLTLTAFSSSAPLLMASLFVMGLGRTAYNLSINTSAVELQKQYEQPIVASFHGIWSLACLVAAGIGTVMIVTNVRPQLHFAGVAILTVATASLLYNKRTKDQPSNQRRPFFVKPDRYLFLLGLMALCSMLCEGAVFDWSVNCFEKVVQAKKSLVTAGYTSFITAMTLGRLIGDRLVARFGIFRMLGLNALLMASGFALLALFPTVLLAAIGFLLVGFGDSILVPLIYMLASRSNKMPSNYALQAVTMIGYTGFLIGPLFIGNVSQYWGMSYGFLFLSGISLVLLLLMFQVKRRVSLG